MSKKFGDAINERLDGESHRIMAVEKSAAALDESNAISHALRCAFHSDIFAPTPPVLFGAFGRCSTNIVSELPPDLLLEFGVEVIQFEGWHVVPALNANQARCSVAGVGWMPSDLADAAISFRQSNANASRFLSMSASCCFCSVVFILM